VKLNLAINKYKWETVLMMYDEIHALVSVQHISSHTHTGLVVAVTTGNSFGGIIEISKISSVEIKLSGI
jgi:hypothetical protein